MASAENYRTTRFWAWPGPMDLYAVLVLFAVGALAYWTASIVVGRGYALWAAVAAFSLWGFFWFSGNSEWECARWKRWAVYRWTYRAVGAWIASELYAAAPSLYVRAVGVVLFAVLYGAWEIFMARRAAPLPSATNAGRPLTWSWPGPWDAYAILVLAGICVAIYWVTAGPDGKDFAFIAATCVWWLCWLLWRSARGAAIVVGLDRSESVWIARVVTACYGWLLWGFAPTHTLRWAVIAYVALYFLWELLVVRRSVRARNASPEA